MKPERQIALLERAEEACRMGSWDWDIRSNSLAWSDNLFRLLGYEPGRFEPSHELLSEHTHPDDREALNEALDSLSEVGRPKSVRYRVVDADDEVHYMHATVVAVDSDAEGPYRIVGSVQDVTKQRHSEREIDARFAVSRALDEWRTFEQSAENLLCKLGEAIDCSVGVLWLPEDDVVAARIFWNDGSVDLEAFEAATARVRFPCGVGLPGRAWEAAEPLSLDNDADDRSSERIREASDAELLGAVAFPVMKAPELLAVLEFFSREEQSLPDRLLHSLTGIGYELGHFLAGRRSELAPPELTPREIEVLKLASEGCSGPEIARRLVISPATIKTHFEHIYEKLGVGDRSEAVAHALRSGLIS